MRRGCAAQDGCTAPDAALQAGASGDEEHGEEVPQQSQFARAVLFRSDIFDNDGLRDAGW